MDTASTPAKAVRGVGRRTLARAAATLAAVRERGRVKPNRPSWVAMSSTPRLNTTSPA